MAILGLLGLPAMAADDLNGRWLKARRGREAATAVQRAEMDRLEALGYLAGSREAPDDTGVLRHDETRASAGLNLVISGHAPEALLLDMSGREVHRWAFSFEEAFPDYALPAGYVRQVHYWRRAYPLPNGDLVAVFEGLGVIRVDRRSRLLWASPVRVHHDLVLRADGSMVALTREARMIPSLNHARPVLEDFISRLDPEGRETGRFSLIDAFRGSPMSVVFDASAGREGDILHTNSLYLLDGAKTANPAFKTGSVIVSMRQISTIAVVNPDTELVTWVHQSDFYRQHDARPLPNGNILLLDNGKRRSRVLEMDPADHRVVWSYEGTDEEPFFTATCGLADRLPNGNTLITESDNGRALEVAPDGTIVWEYRSPHRAGDANELVATLFEVRRLAPDYGAGWLPAPEN